MSLMRVSAPVWLSILTTMFSKSSGSLKRPVTSTVYWKFWPVACGRHADHAGGDFLALILDGVDDVGRGQLARLQLIGVHPDAHRVSAGAEDRDVADAGQAGKLVLKIDDAVVGQKQAVVALVRRRQGHEHPAPRSAFIWVMTPWAPTACGSCAMRPGNAVLHQDLRHVGIGADREGHDELVGAVAGAGRLHVEHALRRR